MADVEQSYEDEQEKLRSEYEGKARDDIHITIPKEPEVNPEVWKDVEPMLYRGFLTVSAEINGIFFVFKSLNHREFELLKFCGETGPRASQTFWNTFLAYTIFMVDGSNILPERDRWIPKFSSMFEGLPKEAKAKVIRYVGEINRRASVAVVLTEAYAMESISRYRWLQLRDLDLSSTAVTGIDGTQRLGLNWAQQLWRAINHAEDRNDQHEREWENAKFIGSCFAGKGISKVYSQDTERRRKDKEERVSRKDRLLRETLLGEKIAPATTTIPGAIMTGPKTVDELATQLEHDLRGDKDWHDRVIEDHVTRIRERFSERRNQLEVAAQASSEHFGDHDVVGGNDLQGLTPGQVENRMARHKQLQAQAAARMMTTHPTIQDEKTEQFLGKWGITESEVGSEVSTTDRDISGATPLPASPRSPATPFRRNMTRG